MPEGGVDPEIQPGVLPWSGVLSVTSPLAVVPSPEQPSVLGVAIVSSLGTSGSKPTGELSMFAADVASGSDMPLALSANGKEHVCLPFYLK